MSRQDLREIVALAIDAAGLGTYDGTAYDGTEPWPTFMRKLPDEPDECIVIECYGLGGDFETGVQVKVRGSREVDTTAEDKADAIRAELHGLADVTRGTTTLVLLTHTSTADLGSDKQGRDVVAINLRALTDDPNTALDY